MKRIIRSIIMFLLLILLALLALSALLNDNAAGFIGYGLLTIIIFTYFI